jgi:hypothetical protein
MEAYLVSMGVIPMPGPVLPAVRTLDAITSVRSSNDSSRCIYCTHRLVLIGREGVMRPHRDDRIYKIQVTDFSDRCQNQSSTAQTLHIQRVPVSHCRKMYPVLWQTCLNSAMRMPRCRMTWLIDKSRTDAERGACFQRRSGARDCPYT